ncbi:MULTISPECIES: single-stranded-DNA-specific exonuclease RecJ [unclassified Oceanobacillus]|uniref:single-stranded-DNA-specific exonuclease RecJ n=1 Tax=unclassified Oceanobacillus TaxID=2630292 RepID=UPI00300DD1A4
MLHSKANWKTLTIESDAKLINDISFKLSPVVEKLLLQRGIRSSREAEKFLFPSLDDVHPPEKIQWMDKAATRVREAIEQNEKILVYGDYDADGVTSTAVLIKALEELGANCSYYIPNRFTEGYGPNEEAFRQAYANGFTVIITVDNGITAVHEANVAKALGVDLIITDHHEAQNELPDAYAIIHPALSEDYPFKELAGVGVAFKFAQYLLGFFPKHLLGFVAIGTIADLVSLTDENRVLSYYGLKELTISNTPGISALKQICKIEGNVTEEDVGFKMGPRLNAVGRLQDAGLAVELLLTEFQEEAQELAEEIDQLNQERQRIVEVIRKEAEKMVDPSKFGVMIVYKENWNEGVLGIVASRLVKQFDRPAIVLNFNPETNELKGSARSIPAFDLFTNCMKVRHLFSKFGGHAQAAGMTIPLENVEKIQEALDGYMKEQLTEEDCKEEIIISGEVEIAEINEGLIDEINRLAPYGMGNPKPVFKIEHIPAEGRQIGSKKNHLKLQFREDGKLLDGIGFGFGNLYYAISPNTPLQVVGELGINEWNGNRKPQIMIQDMRIEEWQLFDYRGRKNVDFSFLANEEVIAVSENPLEYSFIPTISYEAKDQELQKVPHLILCTLPARLNDLIQLIQKIQPVNIYACFQLNDSAYLKTFPTREDFVWLYALFHKRKTIDMKREIQSIMKVKSWSKEHIVFMLRVFSELEFVRMDNGVVHVNPTPEKKDLEAADVYQERLRQLEIEQQLYYSNYEEFKNWFTPYINYLETEKSKEEMINGL